MSAEAGQDQSLWGFPSQPESRWPSATAIAVAIVLQATLPNKLVAGPRYVLPVLEALLLIVLIIVNPSMISRGERDTRKLALGLIALVNLANVTSLGLLVNDLLNGHKANGKQLIVAGAGIWATLVIVFALWYWEIDRGGPLVRSEPDRQVRPDFIFPQMENPGVTGGRPWTPQFLDYVYLSLTNCTAFSPTDTLPLTIRAKLLMGAQGIASLATIAVVAARAVNILGG
jgi:uncharacterized membrane protein